MSFLPLTLERLERASAQLLDTLAARPRLAAAALLALAVFTYLPGVFLLPPVDRTEIVYAQSSRGMVERGTAIDSSYEGERFAFRPIGIYWLQAATAKVLGKWSRDDIATYRLPSLLAGILAVLATWWLTRPLLGDRRAVIAAALFAVSPIVALQATLSIPEGPLLLAIVVAQLTLLRLYCAPDSDRDKQLWLALAFWAAQGGGMLLNALAVPILSLATHHRALRHGPPPRLAVAPAPARRRPADAGHRRAVAAHPRAFRRRRTVQRAHLGRVHPRARRRPGHEMEGGAAHLHARLPARLPARSRAAVAGAAEPVARARRRPAALPLRLDRRLLAVSGADRLQAGALHRAGDVPRRRRRRGAGARSRVAGGGLAKRQARHPAAHAAAACMAGHGVEPSRCSPPS